MKFKQFTEEEWDYLCDKINFKTSYLDDKAIKIINKALVEVRD